MKTYPIQLPEYLIHICSDSGLPRLAEKGQHWLHVNKISHWHIELEHGVLNIVLQDPKDALAFSENWK